MSLDVGKSPQEHYEMALELTELRSKGLLIIGSGNLVHNLGQVVWDKIDNNYTYDWAQEAQSKMNKILTNGSHLELTDFRDQGTAFNLAIPTPEHYLPLLYTIALQEENKTLSLFNDRTLAKSLSMTSVKIG